MTNYKKELVQLIILVGIIIFLIVYFPLFLFDSFPGALFFIFSIVLNMAAIYLIVKRIFSLSNRGYCDNCHNLDYEIIKVTIPLLMGKKKLIFCSVDCLKEFFAKTKIDEIYE